MGASISISQVLLEECPIDFYRYYIETVYVDREYAIICNLYQNNQQDFGFS